MPQIIITFILFAGTIAGALWYVGPQWNAFREIRQEANFLQEISGELDELIESRNALFASINAVSAEDLERINQSIPEGQRSADLLNLLEALGITHGLVLSKIDLAGTSGSEPASGAAAKTQPRPAASSAPPRPAGSVRELPVSLTLVGSYESFKAFLRDVEENRRIIDVENISFSAPDQKSVFEFNLKIKTYYQ